MSASSYLRHGSVHEKVIGSPTIGRRFETGLLSIHQFPEQPYEVNFTSNEDVVTIAFGLCTGVKAYDSDKLSVLHETPGTAYFHPAGSAVYVLATQSSELLCFSFPKRLRMEILQDLGAAAQSSTNQTMEDIDSHFMASLAGIVRKLLNQGNSPGLLEGEALAVMLLENLLRTATRSTNTGRQPGLDGARLQRVLDYIECNLNEDLSLSQLASVAALQLNHFVRAFRQATYKTPHQYVLYRRLANAKERLRNPGQSLSAIAYELGFASQAHFTSTFHKQVGTTPSSYRRAFQQA